MVEIVAGSVGALVVLGAGWVLLDRWLMRRSLRAWGEGIDRDRAVISGYFQIRDEGDGIVVMTPKENDRD